jgi:prepilin peptidase CpaA
MSNIVAVAVILVAGAACVTDIRSRRIPNLLTFGAAVAAIVFHTFASGLDGLSAAAFGWMAGTVVFLPIFLLGGMGAGDVKLIAALGAWLGPADALSVGILSFMAGGVLGIVVALCSGYLSTAFRNIRSMVGYWVLAGVRPVPGMTLEQSDAPRLAYALPIFAGTVMTLWM